MLKAAKIKEKIKQHAEANVLCDSAKNIYERNIPSTINGYYEYALNVLETAKLLAKLKRGEEALTICSQIVKTFNEKHRINEVDPQYAKIASKIAQVKGELGLWEDASVLYYAAAKKDCSNPELTALGAKILGKLGQHQASLELYELAICQYKINCPPKMKRRQHAILQEASRTREAADALCTLTSLS